MLRFYANGKWVRKQETSYKKYIHIQYLNSLFVCKIEPFYPSQFTLHTSIYAQTRTSFVPFPVGCRDRCCLLYCNHGICPHSLTNVPWYSRRIYSVVSSSSCTHSLFICSYIVFLSSWTHCLIQTGNEWENGKPVTKYCIIIHVFFLLTAWRKAGQALFYTPCFIWSWYIPKHWFCWGLRFSFFIHSPITFYTSLHMIHRLTPEVPFHV